MSKTGKRSKKDKKYFRFKTKIVYLTHQMKDELDACFDYDRFCWNWFLATKKEYDKVKDYNHDLLKELRLIRNLTPWQLERPEYIMAQVHNYFVQTSIEVVKYNINVKEYNATHKDKKDFKHMQFKTKKDPKKSFTVPNNRFLVDRFNPKGKNYTFGIKLGSNCPIKNRSYRRFLIAELPPGVLDGSTKVMNAVILKEYDEYFISFCLEILKPIQLPKGTEIIGIDPGIENVMTLSTGRKYRLPKKLKDLYKRKKYYQSRMDKRKRKDSKIQSNRYYRARAKFVKVCRDIENLKNDLAHKITTQIVKNASEVHWEECNTNNMRKLYYLPEKIAETSWYTLSEYLEYKCKARCEDFYRVSSKNASTQTCSKCGHVKKGSNKLSLRDREYVCPKCGFRRNRDVNAAINISRLNK